MAKVWIPAVRFVELLDRCNIGNEDLDKAGVRRLWDLRNGRQEAISLDAADRILTDLGLVEWFHTSKEDGGLADLYFGDEVFVPEWVPKAKKHLATLNRPRKYATLEEADEANRKRSRRKARSLNKHCACGTPIVNASQTCRPCHLAAIEAPHGTVSRYASKVHKCRCDRCTAASATYHRDRQRAMRAAYKEAQRRAA